MIKLKSIINCCKKNNLADWVNNFGGKLDNFIKCKVCSINIDNLPYYFKYCQPCYSNILKN